MYSKIILYFENRRNILMFLILALLFSTSSIFLYSQETNIRDLHKSVILFILGAGYDYNITSSFGIGSGFNICELNIGSEVPTVITFSIPIRFNIYFFDWEKNNSLYLSPKYELRFTVGDNQREGLYNYLGIELGYEYRKDFSWRIGLGPAILLNNLFNNKNIFISSGTLGFGFSF